MMENKLAAAALTSPKMMPRVYCVSNLKMSTIPVIINTPDSISSLEIGFLLISGSNTAVNKVSDDRHTSVTDTVDTLIAWKNNIQWPPTIAPVKKSLKKVLRLTLICCLLNLKYRNNVQKAISTRYQTKFTAVMVISLPNMPVKPHINTVKCKMSRFLFSSLAGDLVTVQVGWYAFC